jgi:NitT/TauT family transport system substrate-binding protein
VREDLIVSRRADIQEMVDGIAKSGKWLEGGMDNRIQASEFVAKNYYNQNPRLLRYVLSKPPDRVRYNNLALFRKDFEAIEKVGKDVGTLKGTAHFDDYADTSFVKDEASLQAWNWKAP